MLHMLQINTYTVLVYWQLKLPLTLYVLFLEDTVVLGIICSEVLHLGLF